MVTAVSPKPAEKSVERQPPAWRKEREARMELAACYRIFDLLGWTKMIFNHITLRVQHRQARLQRPCRKSKCGVMSA